MKKKDPFTIEKLIKANCNGIIVRIFNLFVISYSLLTSAIRWNRRKFDPSEIGKLGLWGVVILSMKNGRVNMMDRNLIPVLINGVKECVDYRR